MYHTQGSQLIARLLTAHSLRSHELAERRAGKRIARIPFSLLRDDAGWHTDHWAVAHGHQVATQLDARYGTNNTHHHWHWTRDNGGWLTTTGRKARKHAYSPYPDVPDADGEPCPAAKSSHWNDAGLVLPSDRVTYHVTEQEYGLLANNTGARRLTEVLHRVWRPKGIPYEVRYVAGIDRFFYLPQSHLLPPTLGVRPVFSSISPIDELT